MNLFINNVSVLGTQESEKDRLGDSSDSTARTLCGRRGMSASKESVSSGLNASTGGVPSRPSSAQPTGKKRQAPKPPVSVKQTLHIFFLLKVL